MKVRLLKKINKRVRIVENNGIFVVEIRDNFSKWHKLSEFKKLRDAHCQKKHYIRVKLYKDFVVLSKYKTKQYAKIF